MTKDNNKYYEAETKTFAVVLIEDHFKAPYVKVYMYDKYVGKEKVVTRKRYPGNNIYIDGYKLTLKWNPVINAYNVIGIEKKYDTHTSVKNVAAKGEVEKAEEVVEKVKTASAVEYDKNPKHEKYEVIKTCLTSNIPIYLAGPAGSGKNYTVEQIAEELGWNFYFSNAVQQEYKLTGFTDAGGQFHETEFYKACTDESDCIFFLDEMDASIPEVLVLLNAAIANGYFEFPNGRVDLTNVHFVAAGNTVGSGADELYTGRMVLDQATLDRFAIIEFGYSRNVEISLAKGNIELVDYIEELRAKAKESGIRATFSYRCIMMVTKLAAANMALTEILKIAVFKGLDKDTVGMLSVVKDGNKYAKAYNEMMTNWAA